MPRRRCRPASQSSSPPAKASSRFRRSMTRQPPRVKRTARATWPILPPPLPAPVLSPLMELAAADVKPGTPPDTAHAPAPLITPASAPAVENPTASVAPRPYLSRRQHLPPDRWARPSRTTGRAVSRRRSTLRTMPRWARPRPQRSWAARPWAAHLGCRDGPERGWSRSGKGE